jgi:hypothetical protein
MPKSWRKRRSAREEEEGRRASHMLIDRHVRDQNSKSGKEIY